MPGKRAHPKAPSCRRREGHSQALVTLTDSVTQKEVLESPGICERATHAARLIPSVLERSIRCRMNFTRIEFLAALARNSGRVFRMAMATTCSEGASPGRTVRIHEPNDCQTRRGFRAARICRRPWAMSPSWMCRW